MTLYESGVVLPFVRSLRSRESYPSLEDFNRDYLLMREEQDRWIETKYDLSTVSGIESIPLSPQDAPGSSESSSTGTVDMYLRTKGFGYEKDGKEDLAIACLRRSNEIRFSRKRGYRKDDYYSYIRMLVHFGHVEAARREKQRIDKFFGDYVDDAHTITWSQSLRHLKWKDRAARKAELKKMFDGWDNLIDFEMGRANKWREYQFVLNTMPDLCPKSQGAYTKAKKDNSKKYQAIVHFMEENGLSFPEKLK